MEEGEGVSRGVHKGEEGEREGGIKRGKSMRKEFMRMDGRMEQVKV